MKSNFFLQLLLMVVLSAAVPSTVSAREGSPQNSTLPRYAVTDLGTLGGTFSVRDRKSVV